MKRLVFITFLFTALGPEIPKYISNIKSGKVKEASFACNSLVLKNNGSTNSCYIKGIFYTNRYDDMVRKQTNLGLGDATVFYCFKTVQTLTVFVEDQDFYRIYATDGAGNIISNIKYSTPGITGYDLTINGYWNCEIVLE